MVYDRTALCKEVLLFQHENKHLSVTLFKHVFVSAFMLVNIKINEMVYDRTAL